MNERFALDNLSGFLKAKGLLSFRALSCFSWQNNYPRPPARKLTPAASSTPMTG
jgi:hypothetical protein